MTEKDKYSDTDRLVCYKQTAVPPALSMVFNQETKTVDIDLSMFHRNDEPTLEPMCENPYSAKYGYWQREITCLGLEEIEFLYKKSQELFG